MAYSKIRKDGTPAKKPGRKPNPNKYVSPGQGKGRRGPRPHTWLIGADAGEYKHDMYLPWLRAKAQAKFRGEGWTLTFEEYFDLWNGNWEHRGRGAEDLCMSRKDPDDAWSKDNSFIISRIEHLASQNKARRGKKYKAKKFNGLSND